MPCRAAPVTITNTDLHIVVADSTFTGSGYTAFTIANTQGTVAIRNFDVTAGVTLLNADHATVVVEQTPGSALATNGKMGTAQEANVTFQDVAWWGIQGGFHATQGNLTVLRSDLRADSYFCEAFPRTSLPTSIVPTLPWPNVRGVLDVARQVVGGPAVAWNNSYEAAHAAQAAYWSLGTNPASQRILVGDAVYTATPHVVLLNVTDGNVTVAASHLGGTHTSILTNGGNLISSGASYECGLYGVMANTTRIVSVLNEFNQVALPYNLTNIHDLLPALPVGDPLFYRVACTEATASTPTTRTRCGEPCDTLAEAPTELAELSLVVMCELDPHPSGPNIFIDPLFNPTPPCGPPPPVNTDAPGYLAWRLDNLIWNDCGLLRCRSDPDPPGCIRSNPNLAPIIQIVPPYVTAPPGSTTSLVPSITLDFDGSIDSANSLDAPLVANGAANVALDNGTFSCAWSNVPDPGSLVTLGPLSVPSPENCVNAIWIVTGAANTTQEVVLNVYNYTTGSFIGNATSIVNVSDPSAALTSPSQAAGGTVDVESHTPMEDAEVHAEADESSTQRTIAVAPPPEKSFLSVCDSIHVATPPVVISQHPVSLVAPQFVDGVPIHGGDLASLRTALTSLDHLVLLPNNIGLILAQAGLETRCAPGPITLPDPLQQTGGWTLLDGSGNPREYCVPVTGPCNPVVGEPNVPLIDPGSGVHFLAGDPETGPWAFYNVHLLSSGSSPDCGFGWYYGGVVDASWYYFSENCQAVPYLNTLVAGSAPGRIPHPSDLHTACALFGLSGVSQQANNQTPPGTADGPSLGSFYADRAVTGCGQVGTGLLVSVTHHFGLPQMAGTFLTDPAPLEAEFTQEGATAANWPSLWMATTKNSHLRLQAQQAGLSATIDMDRAEAGRHHLAYTEGGGELVASYGAEANPKATDTSTEFIIEKLTVTKGDLTIKVEPAVSPVRLDGLKLILIPPPGPLEIKFDYDHPPLNQNPNQKDEYFVRIAKGELDLDGKFLSVAASHWRFVADAVAADVQFYVQDGGEKSQCERENPTEAPNEFAKKLDVKLPGGIKVNLVGTDCFMFAVPQVGWTIGFHRPTLWGGDAGAASLKLNNASVIEAQGANVFLINAGVGLDWKTTKFNTDLGGSVKITPSAVNPDADIAFEVEKVEIHPATCTKPNFLNEYEHSTPECLEYCEGILYHVSWRTLFYAGVGYLAEGDTREWATGDDGTTTFTSQPNAHAGPAVGDCRPGP